MQNNKDTPFDYSFKILTIGETNVGKTCLILRYTDTDNAFLPRYISTIGIDFKIKMLDYNSKRVKLLIWDTAGQERFRHITNQYYNDADGIFLVFDVTNRESFEKVTYWMSQINSRTDQNKIGMILIGNKIDDNKNRIISEKEAQEFSQSNNIDYIETSAMKNINITESFDILVGQILMKKGIDITYNNVEKENNSNLQLDNNQDQNGNICNC